MEVLHLVRTVHPSPWFRICIRRREHGGGKPDDATPDLMTKFRAGFVVCVTNHNSISDAMAL